LYHRHEFKTRALYIIENIITFLTVYHFYQINRRIKKKQKQKVASLNNVKRKKKKQTKNVVNVFYSSLDSKSIANTNKRV